MYDPPEAKAAPESQQNAAGPRYGRPVEPYRLWRALTRAKWILLAVAVLSAVCGVVVGKLVIKRTYASEVHLLWEPTEQERMDPNTRDLFTRIDSVKLPSNLSLIRQRLSLPLTLVQLAGRLDLRFDPDSNLVTLEATSETPDGAEALGDTAAEVFLSSERELARTRLAEGVQTIRRDLDNGRNELAGSRTEYDDFRRTYGISDLTLETQQAIESAANLSARAAIERDRARHVATLGSRQRRPTDLRSTADRDQARQRLSEARGRLAQARAQYSDEHPRVQSLISEVEQLEAALRGSALQNPFGPDPVPDPRQVRPLATRQDGGATIDTTYTRLETQARDRLAHLNAIEGQASSLLASVRVAETRVSELEASLADAEDSARSASPGFRVVSPATRPEAPTKSFRRVIAIVVPVISLFLAIVAVLLWALRGLRVYTANEVAYWARAPVIGSSTWPLPPHTLKSLIDELGDYTPDARGSTLVVAASSKEESLAEAVASRLQMAAPSAVEAVGYGGSVPVDVRVVDTTAEDVSGYRPRDTLEDVGRAPLRPASMAIVPVGAGADAARDSAMATVSASDAMPTPAYVIDLWKGQLTGPQLRRAARLADRVVVVATSGTLSVRAVSDIATRLGRSGGVAFLVLGIRADLAGLSDRVGPVEAFWLNRR